MVITPSLDKKDGTGKIGIYFWIDPVIESVAPNSAASRAGLEGGERILTVNGQELVYTAMLKKILESNEEKIYTILYEKGGSTNQTVLNLSGLENDSLDIGISWVPIRIHSGDYSLPASIKKGATDALDTFTVSIRSLALLFKGIDLTSAVSGPVRITYMAGDVATQSFASGFKTGMQSFFNFLSLISIALAVMNLLPLPVLDGGMIVLFFIELLVRRPLHPKVLTVFQAVGVVLIFSLMAFAVFGDILFLAKR
jgi:regulator of sigma E protease